MERSRRTEKKGRVTIKNILPIFIYGYAERHKKPRLKLLPEIKRGWALIDPYDREYKCKGCGRKIDEDRESFYWCQDYDFFYCRKCELTTYSHCQLDRKGQHIHYNIVEVKKNGK